MNNTGILGVESLDLIASKGDPSGHDLGFISALKEGVIEVNRQPSKSLNLTVNRRNWQHLAVKLPPH